MKRKVWLLALSLVMLFTTSSMALAAGGEKFTFTAGTTSPEVGQQVTFTLQGEQLTDVYGYELRVTYDKDKLEFVSATSSVKGWSVDPVLDGSQITFAHTKVGSTTTGDNGTVELAKLSFKVIQEGDAKVELTHIKLVNSSVVSSEFSPGLSTVLQVKSNEVAPLVSFTDIAGHWAEANIVKAAGIGFVNGYTDGTFRPNGKVTRAEFVTLLVKALSMKQDNGAELSFKDDNSIPNWAKPYVAQAVKAGIINGYSDNTFRAGQTITRAEMAVMVARAAGLTLNQEQKPAFADTASIPSWAVPSVAAASEAGLIKGKGGNRFAPQEMTTRAEAVTLLLSLLDNQS